MDLQIGFSDIRILEYILSDDSCYQKIAYLRKLFNFYSKVNVLLFDSINEISTYLDLEVPSWIMGAYVNNTIIMLKYECWKDRGLGTFSQIMIHEFVHVIISKITKKRCPIWLNEGLAMFFADQQFYISENNKVTTISNLYKLDYNFGELYVISNRVTNRLIEIYGVDLIISRIRSIVNYKDDSILGLDNIIRIFD